MHSEEATLPLPLDPCGVRGACNVRSVSDDLLQSGHDQSATVVGTHQDEHAVPKGGGFFVGETGDREHTIVREDLAIDVHVLDDSRGLPFIKSLEHLFQERILDDTDAELRSSDEEHDVTRVGITIPKTIILRFQHQFNDRLVLKRRNDHPLKYTTCLTGHGGLRAQDTE